MRCFVIFLFRSVLKKRRGAPAPQGGDSDEEGSSEESMEPRGGGKSTAEAAQDKAKDALVAARKCKYMCSSIRDSNCTPAPVFRTLTFLPLTILT